MQDAKSAQLQVCPPRRTTTSSLSNPYQASQKDLFAVKPELTP